MPTLSVILITFNEEANIEACLRSVQWADEIVVLDSHSQDQTVSICRRFTDKCHQVEWLGFGKTKNAALDRSTGEWVLSIDADERITPELAEEIRQTMMYLLRAGFLDGLQGLLLCGLSAGYVFTKYAKLWELWAKPQPEESRA